MLTRMNENHTYPRTASTKIVGVTEAECPEDGGKYAIYCEHFDANGQPTYSSILQDSNKARLAAWKNDSTEWCGLCQEEARGGSNWTFHHPFADHEDDPTTPVAGYEPKRELTQAERVEKYLRECAAKKPYVVTVNSLTSPRRKPRFLQADRARRIATTTTIGEARGFATFEDALAWITENDARFGLLDFNVINRREIITARLAELAQA